MIILVRCIKPRCRIASMKILFSSTFEIIIFENLIGNPSKRVHAALPLLGLYLAHKKMLQLIPSSLYR